MCNIGTCLVSLGPLSCETVTETTTDEFSLFAYPRANTFIKAIEKDDFSGHVYRVGVRQRQKVLPTWEDDVTCMIYVSLEFGGRLQAIAGVRV